MGVEVGEMGGRPGSHQSDISWLWHYSLPFGSATRLSTIYCYGPALRATCGRCSCHICKADPIWSDINIYRNIADMVICITHSWTRYINCSWLQLDNCRRHPNSLSSEANEFLFLYVLQDNSSRAMANSNNSYREQRLLCVGVALVAAACINYHNNKLRIIKIVSYFVSIN